MKRTIMNFNFVFVTYVYFVCGQFNHNSRPCKRVVKQYIITSGVSCKCIVQIYDRLSMNMRRNSITMISRTLNYITNCISSWYYYAIYTCSSTFHKNPLYPLYSCTRRKCIVWFKKLDENHSPDTRVRQSEQFGVY